MIEVLIYTEYILKVTKLVISVINIAFFIGIWFRIFAELVEGLHFW